MQKQDQPTMRKLRLVGIGLAALLCLNGCEDTIGSLPHSPLLERPVATVYKIKTTTADNKISCYQGPTATSTVITRLKMGDLVDLVALEEGLLQRGNEFWLHVYPRFSHRPACYVNTRYLIPYR